MPHLGAFWIPVAVGGALALWWLWLGRDPAPGTVVPRWDPPEDLRPGPAGALYDQRADLDDVLATILDLAARGYLVIRETHPAGIPAEGDAAARVAQALLERVGLWQTEWAFRRTDRPLDDLAPSEGAVLLALFGAGVTTPGAAVTLSALRGAFAAHLPGIYAAFYDELVRRGHFLSSPAATRRDWIGLGSTLALAGLILAAPLGQPRLALALGLAAVAIAGAARWMPAATPAGARRRTELLGLREYLARAEKDELAFRHADEKTPERFGALLPYAIALGVSDLWLEEFAPVTAPPAWYEVTGAPGDPDTPAGQLKAFCSAATVLLSAR